MDACRSRIDADVAAYRSARGKIATSAIEDFEVRFFNNMVLLLDYLFVHRLTGIEGKDGNPLNEVRVLCNSLLGSSPQIQRYGGAPKRKNIMTPDKSLKLSPSDSILQHEVGDEIRVHEAEFLLIAKAFFAEMERKYQ